MARKPLRKKARTSLLEAAQQQDALAGLDKDTQIQHLLRCNNELRRQAASHIAGFENLKVVIKQALAQPIDLRVPKPPRRRRHAWQEVPLLHISDWHLGKVTSQYNYQVASERLLELAKRTIHICDIRRSHSSIEELHLALGGDMIEGQEIFASQAYQVDQDIVEQAVRYGPQRMAEFILMLLQDFKRLTIKAVPGNHGRNGPKKGPGNPRMNFDSLFYTVTRDLVNQALMKRQPSRLTDITWDLPWDREEDWYTLDRILGWGILMVHGHEISGGFAGFPWYGAGKKAWGWIDTIQEGWDYMLMGHFHTQSGFDLNRRTVLANGTVESANHHARQNLAACGSAKQRLAFFNQEHGLISDDPIYLEPRRPNRSGV